VRRYGVQTSTSYLRRFLCSKESLAAEYDTEVAIIPGGCTPVLQPLDVGVNKPLLRKEFEAWSVKRMIDPIKPIFSRLKVDI